MIVLGIDPGYDRIGLALVEQNPNKPTLLQSECFLTDRKEVFSQRLLTIGDKIEDILKTQKPDIVALEKLFFKTNQKTAMAVAESRGVIIYLCAKYKIPLIEYSPPEIKVCVAGHGLADKKQVTIMIERLIKINKKIKYDDEYDAIGVALTCLAHNPKPCYPQPKKN